MVLFCTIFLVSCGLKSDLPITEEIFAMDTEITLTCYGENAKNAIKEAKDRINEIDCLMSTGKSDSEISRLNKGEEKKVNNDTYTVIERALEISKETDGKFNPLMYPIMQLWGFDTKKYRVPEENEIKNRLSLTNIKNINLKKDDLKISLKEGAELDLGGIAKGFASDEIIKILKKSKVQGLVNLGGNVAVTSEKPNGNPYKIGIRSPYEGILGTLKVRDKSVITSGGYERYFEKKGIKYHHIMDPDTGKPSDSDLLSVTVISKDGIFADALSTAFFVKGRDESIRFYKKYRGEFDIILLDKYNKLYISSGIKDDFTAKDFSMEVLEE